MLSAMPSLQKTVNTCQLLLLVLFSPYSLSKRKEGLLQHTETQYSIIYSRNQPTSLQVSRFGFFFFLMEKVIVSDFSMGVENFWVQIDIILNEGHRIARSHGDLPGRTHSLYPLPHSAMYCQQLTQYCFSKDCLRLEAPINDFFFF